MTRIVDEIELTRERLTALLHMARKANDFQAAVDCRLLLDLPSGCRAPDGAVRRVRAFIFRAQRSYAR